MGVLKIIFCLILIVLSVLLCIGTLLLDKAEKHGLGASMSDTMLQHSGNLAKGSIERLIIVFSAIFLIMCVVAMIVPVILA